jgi:CheY-like chemotaxis protein
MASEGDAPTHGVVPDRDGDPGAPIEESAASPLMVLIVEDRLRERRRADAVLRALGVQAVWARTTLQAMLELTRRTRRIELIVVDEQLFQTDVNAFCRSLRCDGRLGGIPIVRLGVAVE